MELVQGGVMFGEVHQMHRGPIIKGLVARTLVQVGMYILELVQGC